MTDFLSALGVAALRLQSQRVGQTEPGQPGESGLQEPAPRADANQICARRPHRVA